VQQHGKSGGWDPVAVRLLIVLYNSSRSNGFVIDVVQASSRVGSFGLGAGA